MNPIKTILTSGLVVAASMLATAPAGAVITTFAQYQSLSNAATIYWQNNGATTSGTTGGKIYTIASNSSKVPGSNTVSFSFLQPSIAPYVTNVHANFTLLATATSTPAQLLSGFLIQPQITGSFSFISTTGITVGNTFYAAGSNLLSATFSKAAVIGQRNGSSGAFSDSSSPSDLVITYSSDFLSFEPTASLDFAISLTSITSALQAVPTNGTPSLALRTFRANSTGSFSSDPAPIVLAVPEPAVWGLMVVGFGMVGLQVRRRKSVSVTAA